MELNSRSITERELENPQISGIKQHTPKRGGGGKKNGVSREILKYFEVRKRKIELIKICGMPVKAVFRGKWEMVQLLRAAI